MAEHPHVPAAFINAIREEGTKAEAVDWLQKTWNERCTLSARVAQLEEAIGRVLNPAPGVRKPEPWVYGILRAALQEQGGGDAG